MACLSAHSRLHRSRMRSKRLRPQPARNAASSISARWPYRGEMTMNQSDRNPPLPDPPPAPLPPPQAGEGGGGKKWEGREGADDTQRRVAFRFGLSAESRA